MKLKILPLSAGLAMVMALVAGCESVATPSGASDPQGERLAQAYHILAKCDNSNNQDDHLTKAMDDTKKAARILGTDIDHDGVQDRVEGDCVEHLRNAQEMLRIAHAGLPVTGEKKAVVYIGSALREVTADLDSKK